MYPVIKLHGGIQLVTADARFNYVFGSLSVPFYVCTDTPPFSLMCSMYYVSYYVALVFENICKGVFHSFDRNIQHVCVCVLDILLHEGKSNTASVC